MTSIDATTITTAARCAFARIGRGDGDDDHAEVTALLQMSELLAAPSGSAPCPRCGTMMTRQAEPVPTLRHADHGCTLVHAIVAAVAYVSAAPAGVRH
jgi:hypothetical protein